MIFDFFSWTFGNFFWRRFCSPDILITSQQWFWLCFSYFNLTKWLVSSQQYFCNRNCNPGHNTTTLTCLLNIKLDFFCQCHPTKAIFLASERAIECCTLMCFLNTGFNSLHSGFIWIFVFWMIMSYCSSNSIMRCVFSDCITLRLHPSWCKTFVSIHFYLLDSACR